MKIHFYLLLALALLGGCSSQDDDQPQPVTYHNYPAEIDFTQWQTWERLNKKPIKSEAHSAYVDIYVNELAAETYLEATAPYMPGSAVIKPLYTDADRSSIARLVVMVKMAPLYSPQFGDWWYGVYDEYGSEAWEEGKIGSCIVCHMRAQKTDFMFSKEVMETIREQR